MSVKKGPSNFLLSSLGDMQVGEQGGGLVLCTEEGRFHGSDYLNLLLNRIEIGRTEKKRNCFGLEGKPRPANFRTCQKKGRGH